MITQPDSVVQEFLFKYGSWRSDKYDDCESWTKEDLTQWFGERGYPRTIKNDTYQIVHSYLFIVSGEEVEVYGLDCICCEVLISYTHDCVKWTRKNLIRLLREDCRIRVPCHSLDSYFVAHCYASYEYPREAVDALIKEMRPVFVRINPQEFFDLEIYRSFTWFLDRFMDTKYWEGTVKYSGQGWFWNYKYHNVLRINEDCGYILTAARREIHASFLNANLELAGDSPAHDAIVNKAIGSDIF